MSGREGIKIVEVSEGNADDFCRLCMPSDRLDDPSFVKGVEIKKMWVKGMLER